MKIMSFREKKNFFRLEFSKSIFVAKNNIFCSRFFSDQDMIVYYDIETAPRAYRSNNYI